MKNYIAALATIAAVFLAWYLTTLSEPDLRYQISSPIQTAVAGGSGLRVIQQIEIANVGKAAARPVQITFRKRIEKPTILKDSEADNYRQFDTPTGSVEIDYESLRPNGRVKIVTTGETLTEQDVEIRDQLRSAKLALTSQRSVWWELLNYLSLASMCFWGWLSAKVSSEWLFGHRARYSPETIFRRRKPSLHALDRHPGPRGSFENGRQDPRFW